MEPVPLYLQLYSLRRETSADAEGTLRLVRSLGYDGVELAGDYGWTADKWRALLDETRLAAVAAHAGLESLENGAPEKLDFYRALEISRLVVPALNKDLRNVGGYRDAARRLNVLGRTLLQEGFTLGYHNHDFEFEALEPAGSPCGMDILLAETDPALVRFEFDTFWLESAGRDAVEFIRCHEARVCLIHAKDLRKHDRQDVPAGQGDVDFKTLLPLCNANDWPVILEYESGDAVEGVRQGAAFLRPLLG